MNTATLSIREKYAPLAREILADRRAREKRPLEILKADVFNEARNLTPVGEYAGDARVHLVDTDGEAIEKARGNFPALDIVWGDIRSLPFPENTFDAILDLSTIDHIPDPQRAIREYARCLKPAGILCLVSWVHLGRGTEQRPSVRGGMQYFFDYRALRTFLIEHFAIVDGRILTPELTGAYGGHDVENVDVHAYLCRRR